MIHFYAFMFTFMHWTIFIWQWYLRDVIFMWYVTSVFSTLIFINVMSLHYAHLACFCVTSSDKGSDSSELQIRGWCYIVLDRSPHLSARLVCSYPADRPLGFGAWCQRGRGIEYVRSRGSLWFITFGFLCVIHYYAFMFTFMHWTTYVWS